MLCVVESHCKAVVRDGSIQEEWLQLASSPSTVLRAFGVLGFRGAHLFEVQIYPPICAGCLGNLEAVRRTFHIKPSSSFKGWRRVLNKCDDVLCWDLRCQVPVLFTRTGSLT